MCKIWNERTDDVILSTQYNIKYINWATSVVIAETIETWLANSSTGNTPANIKGGQKGP